MTKKVKKLDTRKKPREKLSPQSPYSWLTLDHPRLEHYVQHWYKKLAKEGFKDIEGGKRHTPYFSGGEPTSWQYNASNDLYYSVLTNYLTHNPIEDKRLAIIAEMHSQGRGATRISKALRARKFKKPNSVYWVHYKIKDLVKEAWEWNSTNEEGILTEEYATRNDAKIYYITLGEGRDK